MALTKIPAPVLDARNGDLITAQSIGALPPELSDRSDSNPAVVIIEACGSQFDQFLFQLNNWPSAVIQKVLALIGTTLNAAQYATVTQTFALSSPQQSDTVVPANTLVQTGDGSIVFATLADATIAAYKSPGGTISLTAGSTTVSGSGTSFTTDAPAAFQLSTDKNTWYTVASVTNDTALILSSSAASTVSAQAYYAGAVSTTAPAQAQNVGSAGNVAAAKLVSLGSSIAGVSTTTNAAAAIGGADVETTAAAMVRAPNVFATRDMACTVSDYAYFAQQILGIGGRAIARANTNNTTAQNGYVTVAGLSPTWTTSSSITGQERANFVRDLATRTYGGATTIDVPANVQQYITAGSGSGAGTMFACAVYRKAAFDVTSTQVAIAGQVNSYLSPNTYSWGRTIDPADLVGQLEALSQIDHVATINGVVAVGMNYCVVANNVTLTNGSTSATGTASDFTNMTAGQTFLLDQINNAVYLVTAAVGGTLTITPSYAGATNNQKCAWFTSLATTLANWYSLPYSNLSTTTTAPAASVVVVGSV